MSSEPQGVIYADPTPANGDGDGLMPADEARALLVRWICLGAKLWPRVVPWAYCAPDAATVEMLAELASLLGIPFGPASGVNLEQLKADARDQTIEEVLAWLNQPEQLHRIPRHLRQNFLADLRSLKG